MGTPSPDTAGPPGAPPSPAGEDEIIERIYDAVMERRLPPGTRLREAALCEAFGVRRSRIRRSLLLLASRNIVELHANRGASVSRPTADEARHVFEARRSVETAVARLATERANPRDLSKLADHLLAEERAIREGDRRRTIRHSGEFHVLLADAAKNEVLHKVVRDLVARSSLIIAMYATLGETCCRTGDHREIIGALRQADPELAAKLMADHLLNIESQLDMAQVHAKGVDLVELFSS